MFQMAILKFGYTKFKNCEMILSITLNGCK
jgi:hypothetical protein